MEIKTELLKPYTENERMNFTIQQNHKLGYEIQETVKALEAWGLAEEIAKEDMVENAELDDITKALCLNRFDDFFETKDYHELLPVEERVING